MSDDRSETGGKLGLNAALDQVGPGEPPVEDEAEQLALLPLGPGLTETMRQEMAGGSAVSRGPGRPKGAKNRRTEAWQDFLLAKHRSPLEVLAEAYSRPVKELAAELGCDVLDAYKIQLLAAKELAPYIHQKMPVAVDVGGLAMMPVSLVVDPDLARQVGIDLDVDSYVVPDAEYVENQGVSETPQEKSDGDKSDEGA